MFEVEVKVRLDNKEDIKDKLIALGGKYIVSLTHEDTYFNMPKKLRNFYATDEALRVRKSWEFDRDINDEKKRTDFLTYKGPKIDATTKTRKELDLKVEDGDKVVEILNTLGFNEVYTVKKERELYGIEFGTEIFEILFDYLPELDQNFMEIEVQTDKEEELPLKREKIFDFLTKLGINKEESIRKSYLELVIERVQKR